MADTETDCRSATEIWPAVQRHPRQSNPPTRSVRHFGLVKIASELRLGKSLGITHGGKTITKDLYLLLSFKSLGLLVILDVVGESLSSPDRRLLARIYLGMMTTCIFIGVYPGTPVIGSLLVLPVGRILS